MFDVAWQEVLVVGIVALLVVGPKELPTLLRTVGKYVGMIKKQASEFRAQFDEAMRESELDQLRKDVEKIKTDAESTIRDVERSVESEVSGVKREFDETAKSIGPATHHPDAHDANGLPFPTDDTGHAQIEAPVMPKPGVGAGALAAAAAAAPPSAAASGSSSSPSSSPAKADA